MAKAKPNKQEVVKTVLIKPRESFKNEIRERILIGEELYNRITLTADQLYEEQNDTSNWKDYNNELIKRAFNNTNSEYYNAYSGLNTMAGVMDALSRVDTSSLTYNLRLSKQCISKKKSNYPSRTPEQR